MPIYKLKLLERHEVAKGTVVLLFEKPEGFSFTPGQYGGFTIINPTESDVGGFTRRFSLLSTPHDAHIAIATRVQNSAFKRQLLQLPIGDEIKFAGPTGNFTLHEDPTVPAVFIAGGIGITPFYSMLTQASRVHSSEEFTLFYGNQTQEDSAFLPELIQMENDNPHFHLTATMANPNESWRGEKGFISYEMLKKHIPDLSLPMYYVCGSPAMVTALHETLNGLGIGEARIKVEDFPGY